VELQAATELETKMSKNPSVETQRDLETLYSNHQLMDVLCEALEPLARTYDKEEDHEMLTKALVHIYLHRQTNVETLVGLLSPRYGTPQEVADKLSAFVENDFLDFHDDLEEPDRSRFIVKYDVTDEIERMLARYQYPLPMVVIPRLVQTNRDNGYETVEGRLVLNGSSWFDHEDTDLCLDHINRANSVGLTFDKAVMRSEQASFIRPKRKVGEDFEDFQKRHKQAEVFYKTSLKVMEELDMLADQFWLTHKYDRRGRCYAQGYHVSTQGTDYNKAVLQLANKERISGTLQPEAEG
jgi:hypothetical protein